MDHLTSWLHTSAFPAEPSSAGRVRDFVGGHLLTHGLRHLVDDVRLVASELATNAMQHARTPFSVTMQREGHLLTLKVQDGSPTVPRIAVRETMELGGRGLRIVLSLSDDWGVEATEDGSKSVWARFGTGRTMAPDW